MKGYKEPGFQERVAAANRARDKALEKLKAKPPIDEAELAARAERQLAREAAAEARRETQRLAKEAQLAAKAEQARLAEEAILAAEEAKVQTEAEKKAARDARYAARKKRR